jgi:hypothetical protein
MTLIYAGSGAAGRKPLLPPSVLQPIPQAGTVGLTANPLKLVGAGPPLKLFNPDHCALQKVTGVPLRLFPSPMTKPPVADAEL